MPRVEEVDRPDIRWSGCEPRSTSWKGGTPTARSRAAPRRFVPIIGRVPTGPPPGSLPTMKDGQCHTDAMGKPQTIDEYLKGFAGQSREVLGQVRALALEAVPGASEAIKWGHPAWVHPSGTILFTVSGHAKHANVVFTPSTRQAFDADLAEFATGKGSVKLPYGPPAPGDLLRRMMAFRVREHEDNGVGWM